MIAYIDNFLNRITMYRLMLYYLMALIAIAAIFGAFGLLPYSPLGLLVSTAIIFAICWVANALLAKIFRVPANVESVYITAFILALIISPLRLTTSGLALNQPFAYAGVWFLVWASLFAMASKYILAINRKHIFNPAAVAVAITAFFFGQYASWWVGGNVTLLVFVVIGGLLVVRKIQRFDLVLTFFVAATASIVLSNLAFDPIATAEKALIHTTMLFFGFVMLTEPLTTPPTRPLRIAYGALVGALFSPAIHIGSIYSIPELALIAGNIFSYAVSPKKKYKLTLKSKTAIGADTYDFAFTNGGNQSGNKTGGAGMNFKPGQYMEFTLPAPRDIDLRGNRRYFTIASSPTEPELHLGVKFYGDAAHGTGDSASGGRSSTFKKNMLALKPGDTMIAGQLAGDFTLPRGFADGTAAGADARHKLVFIAGGIGITPFRSMVKFLSDTADTNNERGKNKNRNATPDIVLLYSNRTNEKIPYRAIFDEAARTIGLKTVYVATGASDRSAKNRIDCALIQREIPDWHERMFYISGTNAMVNDLKKTLHELRVPQSHIKTDFFPGFA